MKMYQRMRHQFGHLGWWPGKTRLEIIIGAILTQNTAWTNVETAILNLKRARLIQLSKLMKISEGSLAEYIRPAGYFNVKARRIKNFLQYLQDRHQGSLTRLQRQPLEFTRSELLSVNGIGPETADSILLYALGKPTFVVDAYTRRILSRHDLVPNDIGYADLQSIFMRGLNPDVPLFNDYHAQLVETAKQFCRARMANCESCPLNYLHS